MTRCILLALAALGLWLGLGVLTALAYYTAKTGYQRRQEKAARRRRQA